MLYHPTPSHYAGRHVYYNWYTGAAGLFKSGMVMPAGYEGHVYTMVLPFLQNDWVLLGEVTKYVPLSRKRITATGPSGNNLYATVSGVAGEDVTVCALVCWKDCVSGDYPSLEKVCNTAHFADDKDVRIEFVVPKVTRALA